MLTTADLASRLPSLLQEHRDFEWVVVSGQAPEQDLVMELHPTRSPERVATVRVLAGAEVFSFEFGGHKSPDFAYDDGSRIEALRGRIDLAVAATRGPSRVTRESAGGRTVRTVLILDPDGSQPVQDGPVSYPVRRLTALSRGRRRTRDVSDFPG